MSEPKTNLPQTATHPTASNDGPADATADFRAPPADGSAPAPLQVPGYRIESVLGRGGMGVVYKALQEKANRHVALKMILAGAHADAQDRIRFRAEAEAAARLSHPNIVQLYDVGETPDGFPYCSLEYVPGGTLAARLRQGPLRPDQAARLIEALARAMQYAHERGIVHRDLKPGNILLQDAEAKSHPDGKSTLKPEAARTLGVSSSLPAVEGTGVGIPKISDFGLAKQLDNDDGLTRTGAIMGTPAYMAPEQAFGQSKNVGPAADIYALGAILYECLTGRPPFRGATVADTLEQVRTMEPISVRAFAKEIPRDLETICLHCLHKDPARRYASAEAMAEDVRHFLDGKPIRVRPVSNLERTWRWCRRNPGWAAMIALVASSLLGTTGVSLFAYSEVSAQNVIIEKKRQEAENATIEAKKQAREAKDARESEREKAELAKARLTQSLQAVGLFATDARMYCEDAMVPGESRARLYEVLIRQLEKQAEQSSGEATVDALRNKAFLYQTLCAVTHDFRQYSASASWFDKGMATLDMWDRIRPEDSASLGFRATLLHQRGNTLMVFRKIDEARALFRQALQIRREIAGDPERELRDHPDRFAPLADSLDSLEQFEESIDLRTKLVQHFLVEEGPLEKEVIRWRAVKNGKTPEYREASQRLAEVRDRAFLYRDALCETYVKAGLHASEYARRKTYFVEADRISVVLRRDRPTNRAVLRRFALIAKMFGELEFNQGTLIEKDQPAQAAEHFAQALAHYRKLNDLARKLTLSHEQVDGLRDYGRSFYTLGLVAQVNNKPKEAQDYFKASADLREAMLRDVNQEGYANSAHIQIDHLFSRIALGDLEKTMDFVETFGAVGFSNEPDALYRMACLSALACAKLREGQPVGKLPGDPKRYFLKWSNLAIQFLQQAHDGGFHDFFQSSIDADLSVLRDDPRMKEFEANHHYRLGTVARRRGDANAARAHFEKANLLAKAWLDALPRDSRGNQLKILSLCADAHLGRVADAVESANQLRTKLRSDTLAMFLLARVHAIAVARTDDPKLKEHYLSLAFSTLEQAGSIATEPRLGAEEDFDSLRDDSRFQTLLERARGTRK